MGKKIGRLFFFGLLIYLVLSLVGRIFSLFQAEERVRVARRRLEEAKRRNEELAERLRYVESREFLEREARDKLGLGRRGEAVVILPKEVMKESLEKKEKKEEKLIPNWKKWVKVFFGE